MTICLSAANSFLARSLLRQWDGPVVGTVRNLSDAPSELSRAHRFELGGDIDPALFEDVKCLVHLAHDFRPDAMERNIGGTLALANAATEAGVERQVFISSYSARSDADSIYGRTKFTLENEMAALGHCIVRPGLVMGGGMFGRIVGVIQRLPVVPLAGPRSRVPLLTNRDFRAAMRKIITDAPGDSYNLFSTDLPTLRRLCGVIADELEVKRLFVPVPMRLVLKVLGKAESAGLELPIRRDSFVSFAANQRQVHTSNLAQLGLGASPLDAMVRDALWGDR